MSGNFSPIFKPCEKWGGAHGFAAWFLMWRTKYNYKLFAKTKMRVACETALQNAAQRLGWKILKISVMPKVVQLVVVAPPKGADVFAHQLKGSNSHDLFLFEPRLGWRYPRRSLWAKKYDVRPASGDLPRILRNLEAPHNDPLQAPLARWGS